MAVRDKILKKESPKFNNTLYRKAVGKQIHLIHWEECMIYLLWREVWEYLAKPCVHLPLDPATLLLRIC